MEFDMESSASSLAFFVSFVAMKFCTSTEILVFRGLPLGNC